LEFFEKISVQTFIYDANLIYYQTSTKATLKMATFSMVAFCHIGNLSEIVLTVMEWTINDDWS
jgi:hypothetical protein